MEEAGKGLAGDTDTYEMNGMEVLIEEATRLGATAAVIVSTSEIRVDPRLADLCREPRCSGYGLSKRCPPHHSGPEGFRRLMEGFRRALFYRIDVPSELLFSSERREIFQLLHEVAAGVDRKAVALGFRRAQGYAGGSCKEIFCHDKPDCRALSEQGRCRNPDSARPSMSGFGIDVAGLVGEVGWNGGDGSSSLYGLVLIE